MPTTDAQIAPARSRRAAYSVAETARLCGLSRARFYDLIRDGVLPWPVYCVRTRRPLYTADLVGLCQRIRETGTGLDGRYVLFYARRTDESPAAATAGRPRQPVAAVRTAPPPDPLAQEMTEALRAMGTPGTDVDLLAAVARQCPGGPTEQTFESDLRAVFDTLRCRVAG